MKPIIRLIGVPKCAGRDRRTGWHQAGGGPLQAQGVRFQRTVTLRFPTSGKVALPGPLIEWDTLGPLAKRAPFHGYSDKKDHRSREE